MTMISNPRYPTLGFHLLGNVRFEHCWTLQRRLIYEASGSSDPHIVVLICEHPPLITVGRSGSRSHIRLTEAELRRRGLAVQWIARGGGCVLHGPGQLAVYPIVPLAPLAWTVGEYLRRLQAAMAATLSHFKIATISAENRFSLWARSGQLVNISVAVRRDVTCHGCFINVNPAMSDFRFVDVIPPLDASEEVKSTMGCLLAEGRRATRMSNVRATVIENVAATFDCEQYHLHTGHPFLLDILRRSRESNDLAS
jgi:lipoyl(octanoyl) transferase